MDNTIIKNLDKLAIAVRQIESWNVKNFTISELEILSNIHRTYNWKIKKIIKKLESMNISSEIYKDLKNTITIEVSGGIAEVTNNPTSCEIRIIDHDSKELDDNARWDKIESLKPKF